MNQQQQIDIIAAHMAGKKVMVMTAAQMKEGRDGEWVELVKGHYNFDFQNEQYKIEPRRIELFMTLPSGVLQALAREQNCQHHATVSNKPITDLNPGMIMLPINFLEP